MPDARPSVVGPFVSTVAGPDGDPIVMSGETREGAVLNLLREVYRDRRSSMRDALKGLWDYATTPGAES